MLLHFHISLSCPILEDKRTNRKKKVVPVSEKKELLSLLTWTCHTTTTSCRGVWRKWFFNFIGKQLTKIMYILKVYNVISYTYIYCGMITNIKIIHASPHRANIFPFGWQCLRTTFSNFQVYNTVLLTITTMLYIRSSELVPLIHITLFPPVLLPSLVNTIIFSVSMN